MAECDQNFVGTRTKVKHISATNIQTLMLAIEVDDLSVCETVLSSLDKKKLNTRIKQRHNHFTDVTVTPLLWAVMLQRHNIVQLLLQKHVKIDKLGYYKYRHTFFTVTPLLFAIGSDDIRMVEMLIGKGANVHLGIPGPKMSEEEGYYYQYTKTQYPLNISMTKGFQMFMAVFPNADLLLEYGKHSHTCLCYAIDCSALDINICRKDAGYIVHHIVQHGGMICRGNLTDEENVCHTTRKYVILWCLSFISRESSMYYYCPCYYNWMIEIFRSLDYVHTGGLTRQYFKTDSNSDRKAPIEFKHCDKAKQCLEWINNYGKNPSSLKEICRVTIRRCISSICPEICHTLPLPLELRRYINLENLNNVNQYICYET